MNDSLYPIPEQVRRYSIDNFRFYSPQSFPGYNAEVANDYFLQDAPSGRTRILSFSEGKKKGDHMDFYVKYKTEVISLVNGRCARTGRRMDSVSLVNVVRLPMVNTNSGRRSISHLNTKQRSARVSMQMVFALMALVVNSFMMRV